MDVKVTTRPVQVTAAISRGLQSGGQMILAASDLIAPREEGEPRHGVHMVETGFIRPDVDRVAVGYTAFWAMFQEVDEEYEHHDGQQAHFLETAFLTTAPAALEKTADVIRAELA